MGDEASSKPTLVRIKRKRSDESVDALWLEQSASKRQDIDLGKLSLDDQPDGLGKMLFRRLQTVPVSQVKHASFAQSIMSELSSKSTAAVKQSERRDLKKAKKPEPTSREQHEKLAKAARYKQVWRNRLGSDSEDAMKQFFQLYDVDRVDEEEEEKRSQELLMKYMPLLEKHCPEKFGVDDKASTACSDEFVYDVYAQDEAMDEDAEEPEDLLTLQVSGELVYGRQTEEVDSDHDSEDSNREDNPNCDYPDEEEEEDDEEDSAYDKDTEEDDSDKGKKGSDESGDEDDGEWNTWRRFPR